MRNRSKTQKAVDLIIYMSIPTLAILSAACYAIDCRLTGFALIMAINVMLAVHTMRTWEMGLDDGIAIMEATK